MRNFILTLLFLLAAGGIHAQSLMISFAGTGASSTVDSVKVENLSQCTSLTMPGADTLHLLGVNGIVGAVMPEKRSLYVFPNPSTYSCTARFYSTSPGRAEVWLYDVAGVSILRRNINVQKGYNDIMFKGLPGGILLLEVLLGSDLMPAKLVSNAAGSGISVSLSPVQSAGVTLNPVKAGGQDHKDSFSAESIVIMQFSMGDTLKLTGKSGNYSSVSMLFPDHDQTVTFQFTACADADSNHYAVVQIGNQLWMQQNLKTTKYNDGSSIPNVTDSATWGSLSTGAYCNFHNDQQEGEYYGRLYNFYAVDDSRGICPSGWHMATNHEWNVMEKYLDSTVDTTYLGGSGEIIGRILKEGCITRWEYLDTTYGLNSAGFTALCSNFRSATGGWSLAPDNNHDDAFWTATSYSSSAAWFRSLRWCYSDIFTLFPFKTAGQSVRCIKN